MAGKGTMIRPLRRAKSVSTPMIARPIAARLAAATIVAMLALLRGGTDVLAQPMPVDAPPTVRRTSFDQIGRSPAPQAVRFGRHSAHVGDQVEQTVETQMRLATSLRQGNQLIAKEKAMMRGEQHRIITTTSVDATRATAVAVHYLKAVKMVSQSTGALPNGPNASVDEGSPLSQPVERKTYHCRRQGGEDGTLIITDSQGIVPPRAEYEIVAENMDAVGRANPLADFLANRSIHVGDTLELPQEAADRLFNLGAQFGSVNRFELTLQKTHVADGAACAVFKARIEAASSDSSQMRLQVEGPLVVQIDTCRAVRAEFSGPLALSESRGTYSTAHQVIGTGNLSVRVVTVYVSSPR
jgi:hypothetical protein